MKLIPVIIKNYGYCIQLVCIQLFNIIKSNINEKRIR